MKYKEFREYLKGTDFEVIEDDVLIQVNMDDIMCVKISKNTHRQIILPYTVEKPTEFDLIRKALELAETPISEREDKKRYYLRHRFINKYTTEKYINLKYINLIRKEAVVLSDYRETSGHQTKFTIKEIEELKEKFDTDLRDFEIIEVVED